MEKYEIIQRLESLNVHVQILEQARKDLADRQYDYNAAASSPQRNLLDFDAQNRDRYIADKMGSAPKPLFAARFRSQKKKDEYANERADYHKKYKATQDEYYDEYKSTREELAQKDKDQKDTALASAKLKLDEARSIFNSVKQAVDEYEIFSETLKNTHDIAIIIDYFKDERADTIKEAVNLFYDEKLKHEEYQRNEDHRKKMEQLAQEQTSAMREAANASTTAVYTSEEAKSIAQEAKSIAREAINIAEEVKSMVENH